ncbi:hypothetical protein [Agromyces sp. Leaf222]|uniref:hypothetical protein n=1 Tax=Agromyces sp. Leaf222 TaxID=1735688 RepID=UPI0006FDA4D9|nr:hypothetical protein [Agromyces sp. Leaf222]KQM80875.1 hypothetical protein ASE68_17775 [Agromyces sp. Leaf222]
MSDVERRREPATRREPGSAAGPEPRGLFARVFGRPSVRRTISRVVVVLGAVLMLFGVLTARYGLLVVGVIVVGLGAALGPGRIRR